MTDTTTPASEVTPEAESPETTTSSSEHTPEPQDILGGARDTDSPVARSEAPEDDERGNPNAEAAKYRKQLRATEAERDGARELVGELQRAYIELLVEPRLQKADDFGRHVDMASLIANDGKLDRAKIHAALDELLRERPYLAAKPKLRPAGVPQIRKGVPVPPAGGDAKPKSLAEKFGGRDDVKWNDVLHRDGEHAPARGSGSRKVESDVHKE